MAYAAALTPSLLLQFSTKAYMLQLQYKGLCSSFSSMAYAAALTPSLLLQLSTKAYAAALVV